MRHTRMVVLGLVLFLVGFGAGHYYKRETVAVHIQGDVCRPGIYKLSAPAQVVDALRAAGGVLVSDGKYKVDLFAMYSKDKTNWLPVTGNLENGVCLWVMTMRGGQAFSPTVELLLKEGLAHKSDASSDLHTSQH